MTGSTTLHAWLSPRRRRWLLAVACCAASIAILPRWICGRDADRTFDGDRDTQHALARGVAVRLSHGGDDALFYQTGHARFDGQSAVAIYQMAILGLGQVILEHPELRAELLPVMEAAADRLVDPATLEYAAHAWGEHGVVAMQPGEGHAYLGYINLALGMLRKVDAETRHKDLHDRLSRDLAARLFASKSGLIETYPGETWPPDVAAVAGSIGLHIELTGGDQTALADWGQRFSHCAVHETGWLIQRIDGGGCTPADSPRGSGTAVAAYFLSFSHPALSQRLTEALAHHGRRSLFGFSALREYPHGTEGAGDVNAGPIVFGVSVGATGFGLGAARIHGNRELFGALYRSAYLFGLPSDIGETRRFAMGGALGDALILAMLTARKR